MNTRPSPRPPTSTTGCSGWPTSSTPPAQEMRARSRLGAEILRDEAVAESSDALPADLRRGRRRRPRGHHRQATACSPAPSSSTPMRWWCGRPCSPTAGSTTCRRPPTSTLGAIAGRAIGYLAPGVALGGAIVSAGLIETDALDRDGIAGYLNELAEANPDLMDHVTSGGGGLVEAMQLRSLLTSGVLAGDGGRLAAAGGLRAIGVAPFPGDPDRRGAGRGRTGRGPGRGDASRPAAGRRGGVDRPPRTLEELMTTLSHVGAGHRAPGRRRPLHRLPARTRRGWPRCAGGPPAAARRRRRVVVRRARRRPRSRRAVAGTDGATVMLVGSAQGGVAAAEIAAEAGSASFTVDQVVTAGAPSAQVPALPAGTRMLSLEDRDDPVALLGSLLERRREQPARRRLRRRSPERRWRHGRRARLRRRRPRGRPRRPPRPDRGAQADPGSRLPRRLTARRALPTGHPAAIPATRLIVLASTTAPNR